MFDPNTNPESLLLRCTELALEQNDRLDSYLKTHPADPSAKGFYSRSFEIGITNHTARMLAAIAVLKGWTTLERASHEK